MAQDYSGNKALETLTKNLAFVCLIFDDPSIGPGICLRETSKNADIDAVILHKNLYCLVSVGGGTSHKHIEDKIKEFEQDLDNVKKYKKLKLDLEVSYTQKGTDGEKKAKAQLMTVKTGLKPFEANYNIILKKVFFAPNTKLDYETIEQYKKKGVIIIDKDIADYFEAVFSRLGAEYLLYHVLHFFGVKKIDFEKTKISGIRSLAKTVSYPAADFELERGKISMYSLALRAEEIKSLVTVLRMAQKYDKKGFQRMVKDKRLENINREYLSKNQTFPNNIIIALSPEFYKRKADFWNNKDKELSFFDEYNSLIIIDGQHRFFSLISGGKEERPILVTFLFFNPGKNSKGSEHEYILMEQMFYKINKTQERIDPNLSFAIKARIDPASEEAFWHKVFSKLDKQGFFSHRFSFKESALRKPTEPKSIVSVITYGGVLRLNLEQKTQGLTVGGLSTFYSSSREKNIDFATRLLNNYFSVIEKVLQGQKLGKDKLNIREIGALIRLLRQFVISNSSATNLLGRARNLTQIDKKAGDYFTKHLSAVSFPKIVKLGYPASNWAAVEGYILKQIHKKYRNFGNKKLLSKKGFEIYTKL